MQTRRVLRRREDDDHNPEIAGRPTREEHFLVRSKFTVRTNRNTFLVVDPLLGKNASLGGHLVQNNFGCLRACLNFINILSDWKFQLSSSLLNLEGAA